MIKFLGNRGASAVMGMFMLATANAAPAQTLAMAQPAALASAFRSPAVDGLVRGTDATVYVGGRTATAAASPALATAQAVAATAAAATALPGLTRQPLTLDALVDAYSVGSMLDSEAGCIATAVYFEARGESLEGQLAVARVVMNRAASGRYPTSWCEVVKQPWQFSFVRHGRFPAVDEGSDAWRKAQAITRIALSNAAPSLATDVLWYHADYVAPSWGRRLTRVDKIGAHIFYRS